MVRHGCRGSRIHFNDRVPRQHAGEEMTRQWISLKILRRLLEREYQAEASAILAQGCQGWPADTEATA